MGFFDTMLELYAKHGSFDVELDATGDIQVDYHHLVEDVGICPGETFGQAIGNGGGIRRFASVSLPMQESPAEAAADISGRPFLVFNVEAKREKVGEFDTDLCEEFFQAFVTNAKINLHVNPKYGTNQHQIIESVFKGVGRALHETSRIVGDPEEVP